MDHNSAGEGSTREKRAHINWHCLRERVKDEDGEITKNHNRFSRRRGRRTEATPFGNSDGDNMRSYLLGIVNKANRCHCQESNEML